MYRDPRHHEVSSELSKVAQATCQARSLRWIRWIFRSINFYLARVTLVAYSRSIIYEPNRSDFVLQRRTLSQVQKYLKTSSTKLWRVSFDGSWRLLCKFLSVSMISMWYQCMSIDVLLQKSPRGFLGNTKSFGGFQKVNGRLVDLRQRRSKH